MRAADDLPGPLPTVPGLLRLVHRLEQAWRETAPSLPPPELNAYLPPAADPLRPLAVRELLRVDLEMRWRRQLPIHLEAYLQQFPELGRIETLPADLIYHEYRVRRQFGDRPSLTLYRERFPAQYRQLVALARDRKGSAALPSRASEDPAAGKPPAQPAPASEGSPPVPASGKKSGDILIPPHGEAAGGEGDFDVPMVGGYRLLKRLDGGAQGEVWKAEAPGGIEVAIKRLNRTQEASESKHELQSLGHIKRIRHQFLAQIHAYWIHKNRLHVVMELADGSLLDRVKFHREQGLAGMPVDELLGYVREVAEVLDFLHARGIHHRDIKPANILLLSGHVKVADFGLARPLQGDASVINATFCGTPGFMPPEVWANQISAQSDQWSLAVTYLELRLNRRLFKGRDVVSLMTEIRKGRFDLSPLDAAEQRAVRRALRQKPRERYPSCTAFVKAVEDAVHPPPQTKPRRLQTAAVLLACLVVGILAAALAGKIASMRTAPPPSRVHLQAPAALQVETGRDISFRVALERENYDGPVQLVADPPLASGILQQAEASPGEDFVTVTLHVEESVRPGKQRIQLRTEDESLDGRAAIEMTIFYLPRNFEVVDPREKEDVNGVRYYQRIRRPLSAGEAIDFVVIPQKRKTTPDHPREPSTFYIGVNKVTRGQFRALAALDGRIVTDQRWRQLTTDEDRMPIRQVTVTDAYRVARWLGGKLPTPQQWDRAAGRDPQSRGSHPSAEGPYRGKWDAERRPRVAVGGLKKPLPIDAPGEQDDESCHGCRGMAGNGAEWTRLTIDRNEVHPDRVRSGPLGQRVILRGWSFTMPFPLTFEELERQDRGDDYPSEKYDEVADDLGFRVVLEPNG